MNTSIIDLYAGIATETIIEGWPDVAFSPITVRSYSLAEGDSGLGIRGDGGTGC